MQKVVLVEDSLNDVELALEAFAEEPFARDIIVLKDGQEALAFLQDMGEENSVAKGLALPILMMLDLKLPKVDGLEVLRRVKSDPRLKQIPVVMLTSSQEDSDLCRSYRLGANAYVVKPLIFEEYLKALRSLSRFWTGTNQLPILG